MAMDDHDFPPLPSSKRSLLTKRNTANSPTNIKGVAMRYPTVAATFNDLPDELILEILDHLPATKPRKSRLRTLTYLSRTSRRLHQIVTPQVFKQYHTSFCEPHLFLRTIILNPPLAELVQNVDIHYGLWIPRNYVEYHPNAQDKKVIREGIRALGLSYWKKWVAECNKEGADLEALHTILLLHTPNVLSLSAHDSNYAGYRIPKWVKVIEAASLGKNQGRMHSFKHLRSIEVNMTSSSLLRVGPVFRLASLRRFVALELYEDDAQKGTEVAPLRRIMPPRSNNIEEFYLKKDCLISMEKLAVILASSRRLKAFSYEINTIRLANEDRLEEMLGSENLVAVLDCHKESLESLQLTTHFRNDIIPTAFRFNALGAFQSLRKLKCPFTCVCRINSDISTAFVDIFPSSLTTLHLTAPRFSTGDMCERSVQRLAKYHQTLAPALKELRISSDFDHDWKACESLCLDAGLVFTVDKPPGQDWTRIWYSSIMPYASSSDSPDEVDLYSNDGGGQ